MTTQRITVLAPPEDTPEWFTATSIEIIGPALPWAAVEVLAPEPAFTVEVAADPPRRPWPPSSGTGQAPRRAAPASASVTA